MLIVQRINEDSGGAGCSSCKGSTVPPVRRIKEESFVWVALSWSRMLIVRRINKDSDRHCNRARGNGWSIYEDVDLAYVRPIMDQPGSSSREPTPPIYNADECFGAIAELLK
ncbi:hypothetical protein HZH68_015836 [Vespula germanica]|uniref:Uncharacterized protein n=1 Tax=Vespula germanica TaxID=30212 RepID=A0A834MT33_VESGE|nr:hypothetical protein HZH68_015836 [Vespula germanica]